MKTLYSGIYFLIDEETEEEGSNFFKDNSPEGELNIFSDGRLVFEYDIGDEHMVISAECKSIEGDEHELVVTTDDGAYTFSDSYVQMEE